MTNPCSQDSFQVLAVHSCGHSLLRIIRRFTFRVRRIITKHATPLINLLVVVGWKESVISVSVVDAHAWTGAIVVWIRVKHQLRPFLGGVVDAALCAVAVPAVDRVREETVVGNTAVDYGGGIQVWVGCCHDVLAVSMWSAVRFAIGFR